MAIPLPRQFSTPTRSVSEFTVGKSDNKPDLSTAATSPTVGGLQKNPQFWQTIGCESVNPVVTIPSVTAGNPTIIKLTVPLPRLGNLITFDINDTPYMFVSVNSTPTVTANTILFSCSSVPYGVSELNKYYGPFLSTSVMYSGFAVDLTLVFYPISSAASQQYTFRIDAMLLDLPG